MPRVLHRTRFPSMTNSQPPRRVQRKRATVAAALGSLAGLSMFNGTSAQSVFTTWIGSAGLAGNGSWQTASAWSGGVVPNNGTPAGSTYNVFIDGGNANPSNVTLFLNQPYSISNLNIS